MKTLEQYKALIEKHACIVCETVLIENDYLIVEDEWIDDPNDPCKNDDDCTDAARELGEEIVKYFPQLEVVNYYCHRHKYSIVHLSVKPLIKEALHIVGFLLMNGYTEDLDNDSPQYRTFHKDGLSSIDVDDKEVVLISDKGDWLHLPLNIFAVIGALIHYRQLPTSYTFPPMNKE